MAQVLKNIKTGLSNIKAGFSNLAHKILPPKPVYQDLRGPKKGILSGVSTFFEWSLTAAVLCGAGQGLYVGFKHTEIKPISRVFYSTSQAFLAPYKFADRAFGIDAAETEGQGLTVPDITKKVLLLPYAVSGSVASFLGSAAVVSAQEVGHFIHTHNKQEEMMKRENPSEKPQLDQPNDPSTPAVGMRKSRLSID